MAALPRCMAEALEGRVLLSGGTLVQGIEEAVVAGPLQAAVGDELPFEHIGQYDTPGAARGVFVSGSLAYLADGYGSGL